MSLHSRVEEILLRNVLCDLMLKISSNPIFDHFSRRMLVWDSYNSYIILLLLPDRPSQTHTSGQADSDVDKLTMTTFNFGSERFSKE